MVGIAWNVQIMEILRTKIASHIQRTITNAFEESVVLREIVANGEPIHGRRLVLS